MIEICSEDVCTVVSAAKSLTQTLIPEVYRLYDGNKPGTLEAPVSICSGTWGMLLIADKEKGRIFTARLHYPVDAGVCLSGLDIPISITYVEGLLFIIESGQRRIACFDFTGKNVLNPDRMTVKQLQDALKARGLLHNAEKLKRRELEERLSEWIENQNKKDGFPSANEKLEVNKLRVFAIWKSRISQVNGHQL